MPALFVSSLLNFWSRGVYWRDADGDELAVRRLKGFCSVSDSCLFLVGPIKRMALLHCIDIFVLSFGFVNLPDVHGLSSTACILSSQLLSHIFIMEGAKRCRSALHSVGLDLSLLPVPLPDEGVQHGMLNSLVWGCWCCAGQTRYRGNTPTWRNGGGHDAGSHAKWNVLHVSV